MSIHDDAEAARRAVYDAEFSRLQAEITRLTAVQPPVKTPAEVPVVVEPPVIPPPASSERVYGPTGEHWPQRTPKITDTFAWSKVVDCTWKAIGTAIAEASVSDVFAVIWVSRGDLVGNGAGANSSPVLASVGRADRSSRILIVPLEGPDSVTFSGASARIHDVKNVSFVGFSPWGFGKAEANAQGVVFTGCTEFAWAWSKMRFHNITNSGVAKTKNVEFVECVAPDVYLSTADRGAFRNADQGTIDGVRIVGGYTAPVQKPQGEGAHLDLLQFSGSGRFDNIEFIDWVGFAASNQGVITTPTTTVTMTHSMVVGGDSVYDRYPHLPGAYSNREAGAPWPVNGVPASCALRDSSRLVGTPKGWKPAYDATSKQLASIAIAELDRIAPKPTDASMLEMWASARRTA